MEIESLSASVVDMLNFVGSRNFFNSFDNAMEITVRINLQHICFEMSFTFVCFCQIILGSTVFYDLKQKIEGR